MQLVLRKISSYLIIKYILKDIPILCSKPIFFVDKKMPGDISFFVFFVCGGLSSSKLFKLLKDLAA